MGIDSFFSYHTPNGGKSKQKKPLAGDFFNTLKSRTALLAVLLSGCLQSNFFCISRQLAVSTFEESIAGGNALS
jgi:hypothetical protein